MLLYICFDLFLGENCIRKKLYRSNKKEKKTNVSDI